MHVSYLVKRWNHHTASGGYDCLVRENRGDVVHRIKYSRFPPVRALRFAWRKTSHSKPYFTDYRFEDWLAEWRLLARAKVKRPDLVHALYGDEQMDELLRWRKWLPCPLVATFHLPTDRDYVKARYEKYQRHLLGGIDAAIVVGRNQLPDYQKWLGPDRVAFVPHGIDTLQFCPAPGASHPDGRVVRLVSVGQHMRDFEALHRIIDACHYGRLPVEFDLVIQREATPLFFGCRNVRFHTSISEPQLIELYRQADALLLPVTDATANNSVLEAMACGIPVISTRVGGIPDYVNDQAGWLFPLGETDAIVELIKSDCARRDVFRSRRAGARSKSLEFDWREIQKQMSAIYESVLAGVPLARNLSVA